MPKLSININKIALLRNARGDNNPNIALFAQQCLTQGADGITVHPRPDQRHVRYSDLATLAGICREHKRELNIEGYPSSDFLEIVKRIRPQQCTLVPDLPGQLTSDHGWDLIAGTPVLQEAVPFLQDVGIRVSLFVDHGSSHLQRAKEFGADRIELFTGPYARSYARSGEPCLFPAYVQAAREANSLGLGINGGHDLDLRNLKTFLAIPNLLEVSIGHAFVVDCLYFGMSRTMQAYRTLFNDAQLHQ